MENEETKVEFSYEELLLQNKSLSDELAQCQRDKNFVWNLWKNLQVEKPEMTNIISQVVDREQQKSDAKDLKVLNILQQKDDQIKILQDMSADLKAQLEQTSKRLSDLLLQQSDWDEKIKEYWEEKKQLEIKLDYNQEILKAKESYTSILENETKERIDQLQMRKTELTEENSKLLQSIQSLNMNLSEKEGEINKLKDTVASKDEELVQRIQDLDQECKQKQLIFNEKEDADVKIEELRKKLSSAEVELEDTKENLDIQGEQIKKNIQVIQEQSECVEKQEDDLKNLRKQVKEHANCKSHITEQSKLIQNLEALQDETQKVMSKQQSTHEEEVISFQKTITDLTKKNKKLQTLIDKMLVENSHIKETEKTSKKRLDAQNKELQKLHEISKLDADPSISAMKSQCSQCEELEDKFEKCRLNYNILLKKYEKKCSQLYGAKESIDRGIADLNSSLSEIEATNIDDLFKAKVQAETIEKLQQLVKNMEVELKTTRTAHKQRHERYKILQENYKLVRQQLATYEEELIYSPKQEKKIVPRASVRSLQREDSKTVWNELEYYKKEYEKLNNEKPTLAEELDELRVRTTSGDTRIGLLNLQLLELKNVLRMKEKEEDERVTLKETSEIYSLRKQLDIWKEKVYSSEREIIALAEMNSKLVDRERTLQQDNHQIQKDLKTVTNAAMKSIREQGTQTSTHESESKKLLDKMSQVIDAVQSDRLTVSQLDSTVHSSTSKSHVTIATQTTPNKMKLKTKQTECSTQTELTSDSSFDTNEEENKKVNRKKKKLHSESQRLLLLKSDLSHENRSLKKRVFTLETQVGQLRESKVNLGKHVDTLQNANENLKSELVTSLQKLQATRDILQDRTSQLEEYAEELKQLKSYHEKEDYEFKTMSSELKAMEGKLKHATKEYSRMSFETKTFRGENEMLSEKIKDYQERITNAEKILSQKKNYANELKEKYNDLKRKVEKETDDQETVHRKLKSALERDIKNKDYIENLKSKVDNLHADKVILQETLKTLKTELGHKSKLLLDSQVLCRQAETAIVEMENTAYEQLHQQQKGFDEKHKVIKSRYEKCVGKVNEHKLVVKNFTETILSQIHDHRSKLLDSQKQITKKKEKEKQEKFFHNKAHDVACSILNMSTSDLQDFMKEEYHIQPELPQYEDNDIREKLDVILKNETNFGKVLTKFLLDIVAYDKKLLEKIQTMT